MAAGESSYHEESDEINPGPVDAAIEARKRALVVALMGVNAQLSVFPFGYSEIAASEGISEDEARERWRHLELNEPEEEGSGIQITLLDQTASVTVPYWHSGGKADEVWARIWNYLQVLQRNGGFNVYDPQLEQALDLGRDRAAVVAKYEEGSRFVQGIATSTGGQPARAWWKFW